MESIYALDSATDTWIDEISKRLNIPRKDVVEIAVSLLALRMRLPSQPDK